MSSGIFADNSSDARKMLDKAASIVSRKGGTQASFVLSGNGTMQNGTIYIKGNKFYIDTKDAKMWCNGSPVVQQMYKDGRYTDWADLVTRDGSQQNHFINITGAGKNITYRVGLGYQNEEGTLYDSYERWNLKGFRRIKKIVPGRINGFVSGQHIEFK